MKHIPYIFALLSMLTPSLMAKQKHGHKKKVTPQKEISSQSPHNSAQPSNVPKKPSAVTYTFSGGRFGDNLIAYAHAKWISYTYNIPLLYKPFPYSDQLVMHEIERHYQESDYNTFDLHKTFQKGDPLEFEPDSSTLYIIPYFSECLQERQRPDYRLPYFEVDWQDQGFLNEIKKTICPTVPLHLFTPPQEKITVAVHIRKRTPVFDAPVLFEQEHPSLPLDHYADRWWPFKFATDEYYQEQIRRLSLFFEHRPLYVYLFTDAPNPTELVEAYRHALQLPNIEFDCRRTSNRHDLNVLEDFFSLMQFDCLIRVESNFSLVASKLTKYEVQVTPVGYHFHPVKGYPVIDKVAFTITSKK